MLSELTVTLWLWRIYWVSLSNRRIRPDLFSCLSTQNLCVPGESVRPTWPPEVGLVQPWISWGSLTLLKTMLTISVTDLGEIRIFWPDKHFFGVTSFVSKKPLKISWKGPFVDLARNPLKKSWSRQLETWREQQRPLWTAITLNWLQQRWSSIWIYGLVLVLGPHSTHKHVASRHALNFFLKKYQGFWVLKKGTFRTFEFTFLEAEVCKIEGIVWFWSSLYMDFDCSLCSL